MTILLMTPVGARMVVHTGARLPMVIGTVVMGCGSVILGLISTTSGFWLMAGGLLVMGAGVGFMSTPIASTAVGGVTERLAGTASGLFKMTSMIGGAVGVALLMTFLRIFETSKALHMAKAAGLPDAQIRHLKSALLDSKIAREVLGRLSPVQRSQVEAAAKVVHAVGTAHAIQASALVALTAAAALCVLWPIHWRATTAIEAEEDPAVAV